MQNLLLKFGNLRKHPFLQCASPPRETSPAAKSAEKRMFSQATEGYVTTSTWVTCGARDEADEQTWLSS